MNKRKRQKNMMIGGLFAIVLVMAVGYAAFSSVLDISGIANIGASWNVSITNIRGVNDKNVTNNEAYEMQQPTITNNNLTANFYTGLKSPGDKRIYEIEVTNLGSIDAQLILNFTNSSNEAIIFRYDGYSDTAILQNDGTYDNSNLSNREPIELLHGTNNKKYFYITVEYDSNVTEQPSDLEASLSLNIDATQKDDGMIVGGDDNLLVNFKYLNEPKNGKEYDYGEEVKFLINVKNISDEYMYDLNVSSDAIMEEYGIGNLAPGESNEIEVNFTISEDNILNKLESVDIAISGYSDVDNIDINDEFAIAVADENPNVSIDFEVLSEPTTSQGYSLADEIEFKIIIKNNGNLPLFDMTVECDKTGDVLTIGSLLPGESEELNTYYTVTEEDILQGTISIDCIVTANSHSSINPEINKTKSIELTTEEVKNSLLINVTPVKSPANGNYYAIRETVDLQIYIKNTGNQTIFDIDLTLNDTNNETINSLIPGETWRYDDNYIIPEILSCNNGATSYHVIASGTTITGGTVSSSYVLPIPAEPCH